MRRCRWTEVFACIFFMRNVMKQLLALVFLCTLLQACAGISESSKQPNFARWLVAVEPHHEIRGGTTKGVPVEVDLSASPGWQKLQKALTNKDKDRAAILAMAGPYQASFEFLETVGFTTSYKLDRPYRSWGTEYVYVVENKRDFISLQHIMVMFFDDDGKTVGPMVMKHWRQDCHQRMHIVYDPSFRHAASGHQFTHTPCSYYLHILSSGPAGRLD